MNTINRRLLEYPLQGIDYTKLVKNKTYFKSKYKLLLLNYYYNKTKNLEKTIKLILKKSKFYKSIIEQLGLTNLVIATYKCRIDELPNYIYGNKCQECGKIINKKSKFCSIKCANNYKAKNEEFCKKLSKSIKKSYEKKSKKERQQKNKKIAESVKKFINSLNTIQKREKFTNKNKRFTSYDNFSKNYPELELLCSKEYFYSNRYLPVRCKKCNTQYYFTKSTSFCKLECKTCFPSKKSQTQYQIKKFIEELLGRPVLQNDKQIIRPLEIDIVIPDYKLGIEFNGIMYHSFGKSNIPKFNNLDIDKNYHLNKTELSEQNGYHLLHIFENEWMNSTTREIWKSIIKNKLGLCEKIYARNCTIKEVSNKEANEFLEKTHLQGSCRSNIRFGLYYNNELVSLMTFRKHKKYEWEIARFSSKLNTVVIGAASKLLNHFEKVIQPNSLVSFANRRWSQGKLYERLGFEYVGKTPPNYFYFRPNEFVLFPREKFQKHKLSKILENFDPNLTEIENMFNNGYRVIFDCGNLKYVKNF